MTKKAFCSIININEMDCKKVGEIKMGIVKEATDSFKATLKNEVTDPTKELYDRIKKVPSKKRMKALTEGFLQVATDEINKAVADKIDNEIEKQKEKANAWVEKQEDKISDWANDKLSMKLKLSLDQLGGMLSGEMTGLSFIELEAYSKVIEMLTSASNVVYGSIRKTAIALVYAITPSLILIKDNKTLSNENKNLESVIINKITLVNCRDWKSLKNGLGKVSQLDEVESQIKKMIKAIYKISLNDMDEYNVLVEPGIEEAFYKVLFNLRTLMKRMTYNGDINLKEIKEKFEEEFESLSSKLTEQELTAKEKEEEKVKKLSEAIDSSKTILKTKAISFSEEVSDFLSFESISYTVSLFFKDVFDNFISAMNEIINLNDSFSETGEGFAVTPTSFLIKLFDSDIGRFKAIDERMEWITEHKEEIMAELDLQISSESEASEIERAKQKKKEIDLLVLELEGNSNIEAPKNDGGLLMKTILDIVNSMSELLPVSFYKRKASLIIGKYIGKDTEFSSNFLERILDGEISINEINARINNRLKTPLAGLEIARVIFKDSPSEQINGLVLSLEAVLGVSGAVVSAPFIAILTNLSLVAGVMDDLSSAIELIKEKLEEAIKKFNKFMEASKKERQRLAEKYNKAKNMSSKEYVEYIEEFIEKFFSKKDESEVKDEEVEDSDITEMVNSIERLKKTGEKYYYLYKVLKGAMKKDG